MFAGQNDTGYVIPVLFLSNSLGTPLLPKTIETQDFEVALSQADNKELLTKWYQLDSHAQPPCYRLQPIASHIPGFKVRSNLGSVTSKTCLNVNPVGHQFCQYRLSLLILHHVKAWLEHKKLGIYL